LLQNAFPECPKIYGFTPPEELIHLVNLGERPSRKGEKAKEKKRK